MQTITTMRKTIIMTIALLCASPFGGWGAGAWAQTWTEVTTGTLQSSIVDNAYLKLKEDIQLNSYLNIEGISVAIDLNGHKLYRELTSSSDDGHIFWVHANGNVNGHLTILDNSTDKKGTIKGGYAPNGGGINVWPGCSLTVSGVTFQENHASDCGGAIFVRNGATATISNATFEGNSATDHGGAVWNNGTLTATNSSFTNNTAIDVGAFYNAVYTENDVTYSGTATLTGCTFTGNSSISGAGALANAVGSTVMTIDGGTITGNKAGSRGGGIWNGGTLNMKGAVTVTGNTKDGNIASNVFLKSGKVITVAGALTGSSIGVDMESVSGTFTSGYKTYHDGVATFFQADNSDIGYMELDDDGDVCLIPSGVTPISYIERSWDDTNKEVISKEKSLKCNMIGYDTAPAKGQYKEVTNPPASSPNEWFGMGGYSTTVPEYYVVRENVKRETIVVQGSDVHLILCDNAVLTLTGGLKLEGDNKLYIHSQSYGGAMGKLIVTNINSGAAGIGSAKHEGEVRVAGELVIYGGHIEATGGSYAAGIGSCSRVKWGYGALCKSVTVYGGYVKATGGHGGAGIGGGSYFYYDPSVYIGVDGGQLILYDGTVIAQGGSDAAGVGGGEYGKGGTVTVYGGSLTATGKEYGAGIGGGSFKNDSKTGDLTGGKLTVYGGVVTATSGGDYAAGIGGGNDGGGAEVNIEGGTVTATGGGAGIGGGYWGRGGIVTITGGTVIAKAGTQGDDGYRAIGPGLSSNNYGALTIGSTMMVGAGNNGSVQSIFDAADRKNACWYRSYAEISPCTHSGATYTVNGTDANGTHTIHCSHCTTTFDPEPHNFDGTGECSVCHLKGTVYTVTIYLPDANDDDTYTTDGAYKSYTYDMVAGTSFTLPGAPQDLYDMEFAGWLVTTTEGVPSFSTYKTSDSETLLAEKASYTLSGNVKFVARYQTLAISLADGSDNGETLNTYNGRTAASVTLQDRTLYKDGNWNTLCLPFDVTIDGSPLAGATVMELDVDGKYNDSGNADANGIYQTGYDASTSTLYIYFKEATNIKAGKPYIVKWASGTDLENPVFTSVPVTSTAPTTVEAKNSGLNTVQFIGTYSPNTLTGGDQSNLYLGVGKNDQNVNVSKLFWPKNDKTMNAFRAYFHIDLNGTAGVRAFSLHFGDEIVTGINDNKRETINNNHWYDLQGRRLSVPSASSASSVLLKGVYIHNGVKRVIK